MSEEKQSDEVMGRLDRGIEELKLGVQQQTVRLAQEFFSDSTGALRQQVEESRAALEKLPEEIPGGQEESFQAVFRELTNNYAAIERVLDETEKNVTALDPERLMRQGETDATEAARREASELGVDLTEVTGTGTDGRIIVSDVIETVYAAGDEDGPKASEAVRRRAEEVGIDLSEVEGTGTAGFITMEDVTSLAGQAEQSAPEAADQGADDVEEADMEADGQGPKITNAARSKAEELGVDLSRLKGTGAGGLITMRDVLSG